MADGVRRMTKSDDLLSGPRKPFWACKGCDRTSNFACRIRCSCGKNAPPSIVKAAKKAAAEAGKGKDKAKEATVELAQLRKELKELKAAKNAEQEEEVEEQAAECDIEALRSELQACESFHRQASNAGHKETVAALEPHG